MKIAAAKTVTNIRELEQKRTPLFEHNILLDLCSFCLFKKFFLRLPNTYYDHQFT